MGQDEVMEFTWLGFGLGIIAFVLMIVVIFVKLGGDISDIQYKEQHVKDVLTEVRADAPYDSRDVYPEDIINLILRKRGTPEVWVDTDAGAGITYGWVWTEAVQQTPYVTNDLVVVFPAGQQYRSNIVRDASGTIIRYTFDLN